MAVSVRPYLGALVAPVHKLLQLSPDQTLSTRKVDEAGRIEFASNLLSSLSWVEQSPLICGPNGIIGKVIHRKSGQTYLFIYLYDKNREKIEMLRKRGAEKELTAIRWADAFLFFCAYELNVPLARGIDIRTLPIPRLRLQTALAVSTVDYEAVVDCYGTMAAFEVPNDSKIELEFVDALLSQKAGEYIFPTNSNLKNQIEGKFPKSTFHLDSVAARVLKPVNDVLLQSSEFYVPNPIETIHNIFYSKVDSDNIILNRAGGIFFELTRLDTGKQFVIVTLTSFSDEEQHELIQYLLEFKLNNQIIEADFLTALCFSVNDVGQLSRRYVTTEHLPTQAHETPVPGLSSSSLESLYEPILVFEREADCIASLWEIAANLAVKFKRFRSPYIPGPIAKIAESLLSSDFDRYENVYLSLTGAHWKHVFLEIYRVLERLYYFGWMHKLKKSLNLSASEFTLFQQCADDLKWKGSDLDSIMTLFEIVPADVFGDLDIKSIHSIELEIKDKDDHQAVMRKFASMIYSVRNTGVHLGDLNLKSVNVSAGGWPKIIEALYLIVRYFYSIHKTGMPTEEALPLVLAQN